MHKSKMHTPELLFGITKIPHLPASPGAPWYYHMQATKLSAAGLCCFSPEWTTLWVKLLYHSAWADL
jgi:hypothetical protein